MSSAEAQELSRLLGMAHAPGPQMAQAAEQLFLCETRPGFCVALLHLVQGSGGLDAGLRQAGAIYLKNFLRRRWPQASAERGGVPEGEREVVRESVLPLAARAPRPVQLQIFAVLEELAGFDFPREWPSLLQDLPRHLLAAEPPAGQTVALEAAHAVFGRFRLTESMRDPDFMREVRHCAEAYGPAHLQVWKAACERALSGALAPEPARASWELLRAAVGVFHDLSAHVLPTFFCDNREVYFEGILALLACRRGPVSAGPVAGSSPEVGSDPLGMLQIDLCAVLTLYVSRYEEQMGAVIGRAIEGVWDLLTVCSQGPEHDRLVSAGIAFLTAAAATDWPSSPFAEPSALQAICERIVLPNIQLRPSDVEMFRQEPGDYIIKDVEGSDEETRRRAAMDLVRGLRRFHNAAVCEVLVRYAGQLLEQANTADEERALLCKDACAHLVISMAASVTKDGGLNAGILENFFASQIAPELQKEHLSPVHELFRATCLKYITQLRTLLPAHCVLGILPAVSRHIFVENPVVHTYAAVCVHLVSTVQDASGASGQRLHRFDAAALRPSLLPMSLPMLEIMAAEHGIVQNEYLARSVVAIFALLQDSSLEIAPRALEIVAGILRGLVPRNAEYVHAIFECSSILLKLLVPRGAAQVEGVLLPVFGSMWERGVEELLPYCFQSLGLLLDLVPSVAPGGGIYAQLFMRLLAADVWKASGNVPGLIRLLRAYFAKHAVFDGLIRGGMQAIFEVFHVLLGHRRLGARAFDLLNAVVRLLPPDMYSQYFETAVALALARIERAKELEREFVVSMSLFVYLQPDAEAFPGILARIRAGLVPQLLAQVWLPAAAKVLLLQRRKVCVVGLAKLMTCNDIRTSPKLLEACCESLAGLLRWRNAGLMCWLSATILPRLLGDEAAEVPQYEARFSRLQHCELSCAGDVIGMPGSGWDLLPSIADKATGLRVVRETLGPLKAAIQSLEKVPPALKEVWEQP